MASVSTQGQSPEHKSGRTPNGRPNDGSGPWDPPNEKANTPRPKWLPIAIAAAIVVVITLALTMRTPSSDKVSYAEFMDSVERGRVKSVTINNVSGSITGTTKDGDKFRVEGPDQVIDEDYATLRDEKVDVNFSHPSDNWLGGIVGLLLPVLLLVGFFMWMSRRAQGQMTSMMSIGRSKAKTYTTERPQTTFADVAGYRGVKQEINEVVDFLKQPERFKAIGARIPKGILLVGPPGTGKTLLARAVAGEAGVPFMSVSGSDFMEMFVGVGASRVRDLFQNARKSAPAIIFIDEIDSIGRKRGAGLGGDHDEREQTLNQLLAEMDGFETSDGIVMMAATNRPDILDPALLRPGRFDRQVVVPLPDLDERRPILEVHCKNKKLGPDVDLSVVARGTPGMSGADLSNLVNEAALGAVRRGSATIEMIDFETARDRVLIGQRRESVVMSEAEKESTAYHEGGHAVLAHVLEHADPVHKVTILPTGMALGVTMQLPTEERHSYSKAYLEDSLVVAMGGRAAEFLVYGSYTTGASNDLVVSTERARRMVREFGMSEKVGPRAWGSQGMVFLGEDMMHTRDYSDETAHLIEEEVRELLEKAEARAIDMLTRHRGGLEAVAQALLTRETISGTEVGELIAGALNGNADNGTSPAPTPSAPSPWSTPSPKR
jgi:cell division protease FtsH